MRFFSTQPEPDVDEQDHPVPNVWAQKSLPRPLDLSEHALIGYVLEHSVAFDDLHEALSAEIGSEERAQQTVDRIESEVWQIRRIDRLRDELRDELAEATQAVSTARKTLADLQGDEVYDVEYEGARELREALAEASRQIALAQRFNPFPKPPAETSRTKILASALVNHQTKRGIIRQIHGIDPTALAGIVAAGLGTYAVDDTFCDPYPRVIGVDLNESGYEAARAAGAVEPF
jgi:hypothetical protein